MKAFQVKIKGQFLDYRIGKKLNLNEIKKFFEEKGYNITKFIPQQRHVCAILSLPTQQDNLFLKLSTAKGISIVTENEAAWNDFVSARLPVPRNLDRGYYKNDYFYIITNHIDGPLATYEVAEVKIDEIITLSEKIFSLKIPLLPADIYNPGKNHQEKFINKVKSHFESIPQEVKQKYQLEKSLQLIGVGALILECRPRHGDFAPWHLLSTSHFSLIDGEHAMSQSVEYYDIGYFIQRVFSVWKKPDLAKRVYHKLMKRNYDREKLKTILLARSIGGFLDESLNPTPDYKIHEEFKSWVLST